MRIHHSRFQFAEFITPIPIRPSLLNSSHANSSPAISICPSLLNSSHANSSPAIPICCIIIHVQLRSLAPTSAHSPLPPLIQPCLLASNSLLYVYNNKIMTLSPTILPIIRWRISPASSHLRCIIPLIRPCLLASNSLLYVYNNKIMTHISSLLASNSLYYYTRWQLI